MVVRRPRKQRYRKKYGRRNPAKNSGNSTLRTVGQVASTALNIAKFAASVLNVEDKYADSGYNASISITVPSQNVFNRLTQGTDNFNRIGRQIRMKSFHWRANFTMNATPVVQYLKYYILIDKKHDASNTPFTISQYINANEELSFRNIDFHKRFHTIRQQVLTFSQTGTNRGIHVEEYIDFDKMKDKELSKTEFDGTGGTLGDISAYPLYVLVVSSAPVGQEIDMRSKGRMRFVDN